MGVCRVCRGCVGWVCRGRVGGWVCRVCRGCVGRVCRGRVAGVSGVCRRGVRAAGWKQCAPGPATPPPPPARRSLLRVSSTRVCSFLFSLGTSALHLRRVSPTRVVRLPLPADCPRGLPLFPRLAAAVPHPRELLCASPGTRAAVPVGLLLLPLFPGDSTTRKIKKTRKTGARLLFAVRAARRFFIRRRRPPHHTQLQFSPPRKKHPPDPRGPSTRPGMDAGRPPRCVRARQAST